MKAINKNCRNINLISIIYEIFMFKTSSRGCQYVKFSGLKKIGSSELFHKVTKVCVGKVSVSRSGRQHIPKYSASMCNGVPAS